MATQHGQVAKWRSSRAPQASSRGAEEAAMPEQRAGIMLTRREPFPTELEDRPDRRIADEVPGRSVSGTQALRERQAERLM